MFAARYFCNRMFARRYFPKGVGAVSEPGTLTLAITAPSVTIAVAAPGVTIDIEPLL